MHIVNLQHGIAKDDVHLVPEGYANMAKNICTCIETLCHGVNKPKETETYSTFGGVSAARLGQRHYRLSASQLLAEENFREPAAIPMPVGMDSTRGTIRIANSPIARTMSERKLLSFF
jgi:hypothetical protein